jgi:hypothetical protein
LAEGVQFLSSVTGNYSGDLSSGLWGVPWCDEPGSLSLSSGETAFKTGTRPDDPEPQSPHTGSILAI